MKKLLLIFLVVIFLGLSAGAQTDVEKTVERARKLNFDGKIAEAFAEIDRALASEPQNPELYLTRADFFALEDKAAEALKDAQTAAALAPADRKIMYFAALVAHRTRQYKEALTLAEALHALGDVDRFGWSLLINIKMQLRDFAGAFEDNAAALELFPKDNTFVQIQATMARLMGDPEKAFEIYNAVIPRIEQKLAKAANADKAARLRRDLVSFLFARAGYYFSKSQTESGRADLLRAVEIDPTDSTYFRRAKIYRELKMYPEALADLDKTLDFKKPFDKVQIFIERGDVYALTGDYDAALADYREALKIDAALKEIYDARIAWVKELRSRNAK